MTDTTSPTALNLLKRAEALLSALHGSVARHDNLAANLGCAGCELRDQISAALPSLAAAPAALPPAADRAAVLRELEERYRGHARDSVHPDFRAAYSAVANDLSRMADEQQPGTTAFSPGEGVHGRDPYYASSDTEAQQQAETQARECPPGVHSMFDFCPGDCGEPVADEPTPTPRPEIVHGCPPDGSGLTPCCGRTPFELPLTDRISSEAPVTCTTPPAVVAEPGKENGS